MTAEERDNCGNVTIKLNILSAGERRQSFFDGRWRRYLHHKYRTTATATIKTAILKRCMARARVRQCCPNRYPALAMQVTQRAAPRKLKRANARQRMRSTTASGPAKQRRPKMKRERKLRVRRSGQTFPRHVSAWPAKCERIFDS